MWGQQTQVLTDCGCSQALFGLTRQDLTCICFFPWCCDFALPWSPSVKLDLQRPRVSTLSAITSNPCCIHDDMWITSKKLLIVTKKYLYLFLCDGQSGGHAVYNTSHRFAMRLSKCCDPEVCSVRASGSLDFQVPLGARFTQGSATVNCKSVGR